MAPAFETGEQVNTLQTVTFQGELPLNLPAGFKRRGVFIHGGELWGCSVIL
jgi:hypothetical protein